MNTFYKTSSLEKHYKLPGRDHWGAAQSVLLAGAKCLETTAWRSLTFVKVTLRKRLF